MGVLFKEGPLRRWLKERKPMLEARPKILEPAGPNPVVDARFEAMREEKRREWTAAGFPEKLQTRAFTWAEEYSIGMAERITKDPELQERIKTELYPQALELSEKWMKGLMEAFLPR